MGQAASYAESSVQRALLRLKEEEQAEEDEWLVACGYRRASLVSYAGGSTPSATAARPSRSAEQACATPAPASRSADSPLPPPPESFGPLVSLTPESYTLDELRDVLRYLPDPLWVSLHRVSLLYVLDNDHDGRINATDISFFMDWGIKTVGRQVQPDQLAEVLQTCAALHCWHRCLSIAERSQSARTGAAASPSQQLNGGGGRARRRPLASSSTTAPAQHPRSASPHPHGVSSFMLLHLREMMLRAPPGAPTPLPGGAAVPAGDDAASLATTSSPSFASPRSAGAAPIADAVRHAAAVHFAEWMLRLVRTQDQDRRHERQRVERRVRSMAAATEARMSNATRHRHSPFAAHQSLRLRSSAAAAADLPDVCDTAPEPEVVALAAAAPLAPSTATTQPAHHRGATRTPSWPSSPSRSVTPLNGPSALIGGGVSVKDTLSPPPVGAATSPLRRRSSRAPPPAAVAPTTRATLSASLPRFTFPTAVVSPEDTPSRIGAHVNGIAGAVGEGGTGGSGSSHVGGLGSAAAGVAGSGSASPVSAHQVGVLLMDAEPFYAELDANGWCTVGSVEEVYIDFAVEESYGVSFWSFCRLLNAAAAEEVQAALELSSDQAVAVLTSAAAVEEHRRAAAVRQLQRHPSVLRDGDDGGGSWTRGLHVVPMFVVSEYTFVAFVAAFIHAYWAMLESMGVDPSTHPTALESSSAPPTRSVSTGLASR
ncbi:hypothetical protein NESM_000432700 [Novymonas esmeraldas]|uniref:EF-hand domain-containing protein n=1 Tax=Novymonas esmeraldas TaxID=1808958 RepID=A0AAW0EQ34_9TRYP